jgi:hypothetical protein
MDGLALYEELCDDLLVRHGELERTQMMGYPGLKRNGRLVACFSPVEGAMVFKLTDIGVRTGALALDGAHLFDPGGRGRPMKAWVAVPPARAERWLELAEAAVNPAPAPAKPAPPLPSGSIEPTQR